MGLPATLIYRFDNGMILEEREEFDMIGAIRGALGDRVFVGRIRIIFFLQSKRELK